jgi:hypothetical protein
MAMEDRNLNVCMHFVICSKDTFGMAALAPMLIKLIRRLKVAILLFCHCMKMWFKTYCYGNKSINQTEIKHET